MKTDQSNVSDSVLLDELSLQFAAQLRCGENPDIDDYISQWPGREGEVRNLLESVRLLESYRAHEQTKSHLASREQSRLTEIPSRLGDFQLVREIGRGGMGVVYEALQGSLDRRVALKVLPRLGVEPERHRIQFRHEAEAAAGLHHTNIVPIYAFGEDAGLSYFAMQLIDGISLNAVIRTMRQKHDRPASRAYGATSVTDDLDPSANQYGVQVRPQLDLWESGPQTIVDLSHVSGKDADVLDISPFLPHADSRATDWWRIVANLAASAADAVHFAHQHSLIHRDIKPSNLVLDRQGQIWITDFGLAQRLDTNGPPSCSGAGTIRYMAPEQCFGAAEVRSDVYSLGLLIFELLTLEPAFDSSVAGSAAEMRKQRSLPEMVLIDRSTPREFEAIVRKATRPSPEERYSSAHDLASDIRRLLGHEPVHAAGTGPAAVVRCWIRRGPGVALLATIAALLLIGLASLLVSSHVRQSLALSDTRVAKARAQQAEAKAALELSRADRNLQIAVNAFEDITRKLASRSHLLSLLPSDADDENVPLVTFSADSEEIALLEDVLDFFTEVAQNNSDHLSDRSAQALRRAGTIQQYLGHFDLAEETLRAAAEAFEELQTDGGLPAAGTMIQLATVHMMQRRFETAGTYLQRAEAILRSSHNFETTIGRFQLARTLELRARAESSMRSPRWGNRDAIRHRLADEALELLGDLVDSNPENRLFRLALGRAWRERAAVARRQGEAESFETAVNNATLNFEQLLTEDPEDHTVRYELTDTLCMFTIDDMRIDPESYRARIHRAVAMAESLLSAAADPKHSALASVALLRLADLQSHDEDDVSAIQTYKRTLGLQKRLADRFPAIRGYELLYVRTLSKLADVHGRNRRYNQGVRILERATSHLKQWNQAGNAEHRLNWTAGHLDRRLQEFRATAERSGSDVRE